MEQIDMITMDELANRLLSEASNSFRSGQFEKALDTLIRCIRAPKSKENRELDVRVYNMLGLIYGYLNQETLSKENLMKALRLGTEYGAKDCMIQSYMNLGFLYQKLGVLESAQEYVEQALALIKECGEEESVLYMPCLACYGIIRSKLGNDKWDMQDLKQTEGFFSAVQDLKLRVSYQQGDRESFEKYLEELTSCKVEDEKFLIYAEFYLDICAFLWEKELYKELRKLLDYMKQYLQKLPLAYLKYQVCNYEVLYAKKCGTKEEQWEAEKNWMEILPQYEQEQQNAKMYSFDYVEYLHEEKSLSDKMEQRSKQDPMTGLLNKYTLEFLAEEYMKQKEKDDVAAVLVIDMDHFKQVNDTLGHLAGDTILSDTAIIIQKFFKEDNLCGRIGGDEFAIFIKNVQDISSLLIQAEFLRQEIAKTTSERSVTIEICASIGIALSTAGFTDYASLFAAADKALYQAKKNGRNKIEVIE